MRNENLSLLVTSLLASISVFVFGVLMASVPTLAQQGQPVLQITSPAPDLGRLVNCKQESVPLSFRLRGARL